MGIRTALIAGVVLGIAGCGTSDPAMFEPGPNLLAEMISGRIMAGDIPDHGLPNAGDQYYVVQLDGASGEWGELRSEMFSGAPSTVVVTTLEALRAESRTRGGDAVAYLGVGTPTRVSDNRWLVRMGGDYAVPEPEQMRLCCCTGDAVFEVGPGRLRFLEWAMVVCS